MRGEEDISQFMKGFKSHIDVQQKVPDQIGLACIDELLLSDELITKMFSDHYYMSTSKAIGMSNLKRERLISLDEEEQFMNGNEVQILQIQPPTTSNQIMSKSDDQNMTQNQFSSKGADQIQSISQH